MRTIVKLQSRAEFRSQVLCCWFCMLISSLYQLGTTSAVHPLSFLC